MTRPTRPSTRKPTTGQALLAALFSALFPGAGQWYAGKRNRAYAFFAVNAIGLLILFYLLARGKLYVARLSVQPNWILAMLLGLVAFAAIHLFSIFDAFKSVRPIKPKSTARTLAVLATLLLVLVSTAVPHYQAGRRAWLQYDLITSVFADDEPATASSTSTSTSSTSSTTLAPGQTAPPTSATTTSSTTTTTLPPLWADGERLNVLLLGGDAGEGRTSVRTDTMIVVSIDPETGYAAMMSVPRNLYNLPFLPGPAADAFPAGFDDLSNAIYRYGLEHPDDFPGAANTGAAAIKSAISATMGIPVHYYVLVNLEGFVDIIDALGGVDMRVEDRVYDAQYPHEDGTVEIIDIQPGVHHFDGHTALAYARSRRASDDYNRMGRQRCVLEAVAEQADVFKLILAFPTLVPVIKESVTTDIPISRLPDMIELLDGFDTEEMVTVRFIPPRFADGSRPDLPLIKSTVETIMALPPAEAILALNLQNLNDACPKLEEPTPATTTSVPANNG